MPADTDERIRQLCARLSTAKEESEIRMVVGKLRAAISEHLSRARSSLQTKASVIHKMDAEGG
jgi:hypothetical protein